MSAVAGRRHLVNRQRQSENSSAAQRPRHHEQETEAVPLPPYLSPSCPLSTSAKRALEDLQNNYDFGKYKKHLKTSMSIISTAAADSNDRLRTRQLEVQRLANRRRERGIKEIPSEHVDAETYADSFERKVSNLTIEAERAIRALIDYGDELAMQDSFMKEVGEKIPIPPSAHPSNRRQRRDRVGEDEEENEEPEDLPVLDGSIFSTVEFLNKVKEDYATQYKSRTMRERYGDDNNYKNFKRSVHDALHGPDAAPLPHARTWFPEDTPGDNSGLRRDEGQSDDEDIIISKATNSLKCPLTLQYFEEPYNNNVCNHTFEKAAILEYHHANAVAYPAASQRGRGPRPQGPKRVKCPQAGCDAMLELKDFFDDHLIARQVRRAQKKAPPIDDDEDDENIIPRGTQQSRPEEVDSQDDGIEIDEEEERMNIAKIKRERQQSRGLSMAPSHARANSSESDQQEMGSDVME